MMRFVWLLLFVASAAHAEVLVAARTIPAQTVISAGDIAVRDMVTPGGLTDPHQVIGLEARVALFAGRPIRQGDVGTPAVVERNQIVPLIYAGGGLTIKTDGRALDRAGVGELIRVMNLDSRTTVTALIDEMGNAHVRR